MKTLALRNAGATINVQIKVDIFATNAQLQEAGFDTRFTNMTLDNYDTLASQTLGNIQEIENNWQSIVALANATAGVGLYLSDINEPGAEIEIVAP